MTHREFPVHRIENHPRGGLQVFIEPATIEPDRVYGAQLQCDLFTPTPGQSDTRAPGIRYIDGILGDPTDGDYATLAINTAAQRANKQRRLGKTATTTGVLHEPEGWLYVDDTEIDS